LSLPNVATTNGVANISGTNVVCTPAANFTGTVVLSYTIRDPGGVTASANITVSVVASNNVPVAVNDIANTLEDAAVSIAVLANDSDPDGDALTITGATPTNGTVSIVGTNLVFTPATNFTGTAFIDYTISDGFGGSAGALVTVSVTAVNDAPIAFSQSLTNAEDTPLPILLTGADVDGPVTNFTVLTQPASGSLSGSAPNLIYNPATNFVGVVSFTFDVNDGSLTSAVATVTITITNVNDAPVAVDDVAGTRRN